MQLSQTELAIADRIARERHKASRDADIPNQKIGPQSDYATDLNGMLAEIAVAKALNVYPDLTINAQAGGIDLTYMGTTIDVKGTEYTDGMLLAPTWKQHKKSAEVFVLVTLDWPGDEYEETPDIVIPGWAKADRLLQSENIVNFGHGPGFGLDQDDLRDIEELAKFKY